MKYTHCSIFLLVWYMGQSLQAQNAQVTFQIPAANLPQYTPIEGDLYVAGSFNNWNPARTDYKMVKLPNGNYTLGIDSLTAGQTVEYKFTRGNWDFVETLPDGSFLPNRTFTVSNGAFQSHTIGNWDDMSTPSINNTPAGEVRILNAEFSIPQLGRTRRIWIYLPPDYHLTTQSYPVIYLQDGQNLFDNATSFSGEWGVDEGMEQLFAGGDPSAIVVGIDNGGASRIDEYSPWVNTQYGGGEGDSYMEFIVNTLKPHIDANFRTLTDRNHTAIGGSSMGGLISMYGGIEYQQVFSKILVFSPSFWFSNDCYAHVQTKGRQSPMRIYLMCGTPEGNGSVQTDMQQMYNTLLAAGFPASELKFVTKSDGQHSEWFWRREYPDGYKWLFESAFNAIEYSVNDHLPFVLSPVPFRDTFTIEWKTQAQESFCAVFNSTGQNVFFDKIQGNATLNLKHLPAGVYLLILEQNGKTYRKKILKES